MILATILKLHQNKTLYLGHILRKIFSINWSFTSWVWVNLWPATWKSIKNINQQIIFNLKWDQRVPFGLRWERSDLRWNGWASTVLGESKYRSRQFQPPVHMGAASSHHEQQQRSKRRCRRTGEQVSSAILKPWCLKKVIFDMESAEFMQYI